MVYIPIGKYEFHIVFAFTIKLPGPKFYFRILIRLNLKTDKGNSKI